MRNSELVSSLPIAIQLKESEFRSWKVIDENKSDLIYNWDKIDGINVFDQKQNIQIAVAKHLHNSNVDAIKRITKAIRQSKDLEENDRVFGVDHQNIKKVGYIASKTIISERNVSLQINWVSNVPLGKIRKHIFSENEELQILSSHQFNMVIQQFPTQINLLFDKMPPKLEGIADKEFMIESSKASLSLYETKIDQGGTVTLFYGTNRNRIEQVGEKIRYGRSETQELKFGSCKVSIPRKHRQGHLERPNAIGRVFRWESGSKHFIIKATDETDESTFISNFTATLNVKPKKQGLIFIHGYNTTFDESAYRAAQLAWDLPFKGYTGFFSWPSSGTTSAYGNDEAAARSSAHLLKEFISKIAKIKELEALHIIAHSMGGLILTLSLNIMAADLTTGKEIEKISQLILGAPDIDKGEFINNILPAFRAVGKQRTLYASDHDEALNLSTSLRSLRDRLGLIGTGIFVANGLDSVNASNLKADSHSYIFEGKELLSDIHYAINHGLSPHDRRLREIQYTPGNYWLFPE